MMKMRGNKKRTMGINRMGAAEKGRPVVAHGAAGRKMRKGGRGRR